MARRSDFERGLREIHGDQVEFDGADYDRDAPRQYRHIRPGPAGARYSSGTRALAGLAMIPLAVVAIPMVIVGLGALGLLWLCLKAMFHITFG